LTSVVPSRFTTWCGSVRGSSTTEVTTWSRRGLMGARPVLSFTCSFLRCLCACMCARILYACSCPASFVSCVFVHVCAVPRMLCFFEAPRLSDQRLVLLALVGAKVESCVFGFGCGAWWGSIGTCPSCGTRVPAVCYNYFGQSVGPTPSSWGAQPCARPQPLQALFGWTVHDVEAFHDGRGTNGCCAAHASLPF
jgi:hypothetical protein